MPDKIAVRTVSDYLARAEPPFTTKVIQDQEPEELTEEWKEGARKWLRSVKKIRLDTRIYEDETPVYANEAPTRGRARRGTPIIRARSRYAKKFTSQSGVVFCIGSCRTKTQTLGRSSELRLRRHTRCNMEMFSYGTV